MNHTVKYLALFSLAFSLAACDDDGLDVRDVEIPQGYALSAGISTIFLNSSVAYDTQADWIDADPDYAKAPVFHFSCSGEFQRLAMILIHLAFITAILGYSVSSI